MTTCKLRRKGRKRNNIAKSSICYCGMNDCRDPLSHNVIGVHYCHIRFYSHFWRKLCSSFVVMPTETVGQKLGRAFDEASSEIEDAFSPFVGYGHCNVDVLESKEQCIVDASAPGFRKDNLRLTIDGRYLYLEGTPTMDDETQGKKFKHREIRVPFKRRVLLPKDVNPHNVNAKFENGLIHCIMDREQGKGEENIKRDVYIS